MTQHFLLSSKARTLSLAKVMRLSEQEAFEAFRALRWSDTNGAPVCPRCACAAVYQYKARSIFKCKGCNKQFSVTTGTIFASHKLPLRDILAAIAIFVNGAKGHSALQLSRDLDVQYKTAFVLSHKIREALAGKKPEPLTGEVEVDGAYFGGHVKPANRKEDRKDLRLLQNRSGKRRVVVVMRQRGGRTLPFVFTSEAASLPAIQAHVTNGATVYADEAPAWDALHARYLTKRINHSEAYSAGGACTNQAESYFSRLRRAEIGVHHVISGPYLGSYAAEMAWREDNRRISNGEQYLKVANAALNSPVSRVWKGYWQRAA
ncbi:MAG TPA: IS1595 family transposase [Bryobacteraceae bacterium]|jgi:transposase-like protein|nr:IS1595 family transposase [Bryobacteraceae bacterium]